MVSSFLLKKGGSVVGLRRNWKRRWFLLENDTCELHYYADPSLNDQKGTVRLSAKSSVRVPETVSMRGRHRPKPGEATHYFELWDVQDAHGRSRKTFKVRAESPRDFANWLEALDACLRRLRGDAEAMSRSSNEAWAAPHTPRTRAEAGERFQHRRRRLPRGARVDGVAADAAFSEGGVAADARHAAVSAPSRDGRNT